MAAGVKVRGSCKAGHITEATAAPRRVTWEGPCSHDGCPHTVVARRVPREKVPPAAAPEQPTADSNYPFVEVHSYDQLGHDGDGLTVEPASEPAAVPAGDQQPAGSAPTGDPEPVPDPVSDEPGSERRRFLRRSGGRERGEWQHPLL